MSYSSLGRKAIRKVRRCHITVRIAGTSEKLTIFQWTSVKDLKQEISRITMVPIQDQRLFYGHIELSNSRLLNDYHVFNSEKINRVINVELKKPSGNFVRIVPGSLEEPPLPKLVVELNQALALGLAPTLTLDGTGGTYMMRNALRKLSGVFKPLDEEAFACMNPRGHVGKIGTLGFRNGVLSGEGGYREVAAYMLDYEHFSGVPPTTLVEAQHETFCYSNSLYPKKGSLQKFVKNKGCVEDFSNSLFSKEQVQKIAILDIRLLNMDRNEANMIVLENYELVPIDHGLTIPDCFDISQYDLCWMEWVHTKDPFTPTCLDYVQKLNPLNDILLLRNTMPFRDACLRNIRISSTLLKKGAEAGLSLHSIGSLLYRPSFDDEPSVVEQVVDKALKLYRSIHKGLTKMLKIEKSLEPKQAKRDRAYSVNEMEFCFPASPRCNADTDESDPLDMVMTISELSSSEEEDREETFAIKDSNGRSLSLPSLVALNSQPPVKAETNDEQAFNNKLFYYIEAFLEQSIQIKLRQLRRFEAPGGRLRSISNAFA